MINIEGLFGVTNGEEITEKEALNIPAVAACIEFISSTIAGIPIMLYKTENHKVISIDNDKRVQLLNDDTKDTLTPFQMKKALIKDYLLYGTGYLYINKNLNAFSSLNYVANRSVSIMESVDPIFKSYDVLVNGQKYRDFEFIKLTKNTINGATSKGILQEHPKMLAVAYNSLDYELNLVKTGGKKGFLQASKTVKDDVLLTIKKAWQNLYSNNKENIVVLNDGLEFKDAGFTSVEMQLAENKVKNSEEICKLFTLSSKIINGECSTDEYYNIIKVVIIPIIKAFESTLNKEFLLENEKSQNFYFSFDTKEILKGDIEKRYKAYEIGIKNGFIQTNEIRYLEDMEKIEGLDFIKLGLADVLYNPATGEIYTPNTNTKYNINDSVNNVVNSQENTLINNGDYGIIDNNDNKENTPKISDISSTDNINLNGAQIASLIQIVSAVSKQELQYESATTIIKAAFPFDDETVKNIVGEKITTPKIISNNETENRYSPNQPRNKDGEFSGSGGGSSNKKTTNSSLSENGTNKLQNGFSKANLDKHWDGSSSHKKQYPNFTKEQYAKRAKDLLEMPTSKSVLGYKNSKNQIIRYDINTNDFVKGNKNGIATMFKPENSIKYYSKQKTNKR